MLKKLKLRLAGISFIRKAVEEPVDLEIFKKKPSKKFIVGISLIGLSNLTTWPLIILLGIIASNLQKPSIFVIGSPVAYLSSTLIFFIGVWLAGREGIKYMRVFIRWLVGRICTKLLVQRR